ncbi:MAG: divergent PAP2 family protein [Lachnospiraceae bacterium]|nr:divergent PAP2 family protein [Lachnospiraceae bacterium]
MEIVFDLLENKVLISAGVSWLIAQIIKTVLFAIKHHTLDLKRMIGSGGMPSAHSATVVSIATSCGFVSGFDSPTFALALIFAIVVIHDAMGVRLEAEKHAKILNKYMEKEQIPYPEGHPLKEYIGHTLPQIVFGCIIGIIIPCIICTL